MNGLPGDTVSFLKSLPGAVGANLLITGVTEHGHSSHGPGLPVFDIQKIPVLISFIKTTGTGPNPSFCTTLKDGTKSCHSKWLYNGYWFTDEDSAHFHVCKDGTAGPSQDKVALFTKACTKI